MTSRAWMVRILEREELCLQSDTVAIGWAEARGLNDPQLTLKAVILGSYPQYKSPYALGQVAGIVWRFVREIAVGDWIVAPTRTGLNIAKVAGPSNRPKTTPAKGAMSTCSPRMRFHPMSSATR